MKIAPCIALTVMATFGTVSTAAWASEPDNVYNAWDNYNQHYDSAGHIINPGTEPTATGSTTPANNTTQAAAPAQAHAMRTRHARVARHHVMQHRVAQHRKPTETHG